MHILLKLLNINTRLCALIRSHKRNATFIKRYRCKASFSNTTCNRSIVTSVCGVNAAINKSFKKNIPSIKTVNT